MDSNTTLYKRSKYRTAEVYIPKRKYFIALTGPKQNQKLYVVH